MRRPLPFGKYLLLERIAVGGMAEVFIAKAFGVEGFERILAIKRILPTMAEDNEFISMFIDEARISVQLNHSNIVHIHELGRYGEAYFIAMEYVSGRDLRQVLEYYQREQLVMPAAQAVYIASKMCDGLDHAHRKRDARGTPLNIVHRDVSPQNVLLSFDGEVKLIDFGIAKAAGRLQKTQAGILKGKFGYMSPEQVRGLEIDHRSDIFAVGVVLYEMLTGHRLFTGESDFSVLERVRDAVVPPPRELNADIPEGLETVLLRALSGEREDRYQWASEFQEDLMRFLLSGDALYGPKHLSAFLTSAFAEEVEIEAERMERFANLNQEEDGDDSVVPTAYGPRPDVAEAPAEPPSADRTMITEAPAVEEDADATPPPASASVRRRRPSSRETPRARTPVRDQVVIGSGEKYDGATRVGPVPSAPVPELSNADKTFVGEVPAGFMDPSPSVDASALHDEAEAVLANETYVGPVPTAEPATAGDAPMGAIPDEDDDEQDTRMLEAAEFEAQGFEPPPEMADGPAPSPADDEGWEAPAARGDDAGWDAAADEDEDTGDVSPEPGVVVASGVMAAPAGAAGTFEEEDPVTRLGEADAGYDDEPYDDEPYDDDAPESPDAHGGYDDGAYADDAADGEGPYDDEAQTGESEVFDEGSDGDAYDADAEEAEVAPARPRRAAASGAGAVPSAIAQLKTSFQERPKPWLIGGGAALVLLLGLGLVALLGGGGPMLTVHVDPASARLTVNGQSANPGQVVATGPGVYLVRAEASGYLADERTIELFEDSPAEVLTLRLGQAPIESPTDPAGEEGEAVAQEASGEAPEEPEAPAAEPARALFMGNVEGAEILLDDAVVGRLPDFETGALEGGRRYAYTVRKEGYQTVEDTFTAVEGHLMEIEVTLEEIPKPKAEPAVATSTPRPRPARATRSAPRRSADMGRLALSSNPSGAEIYIDGRNTGRKTPVGLSSALPVPVGEHTIVFKLDGKSSKPQKIQVSKDGITKLAGVPIP